MRRMSFLIAFLGFGLTSYTLAFGEGAPDANRCILILQGLISERRPGYSRLTDVQQEFLKNIFLPVTGRRAIQHENGRERTHRVGTSFIEISDFPGGFPLRIEWVASGEQPMVVDVSGTRTLQIPRRFDWTTLPDNGRGIIQTFLVGHTLHPFIHDPAARAERVALGEYALFLRNAQREGIDAALDSIDRFVNGDSNGQRFLYVAPTGTGKTEILKAILRRRIEQNGTQLHIVVADQNALVNQLFGDARDLQAEMGNVFQVVQWGGEFGSIQIVDLLQKIGSSNVPIVLVTTIQSLRPRYDQANSRVRSQLRNLLGTIVYDEAHHSGAPEAYNMIDSIMQNNRKTFLAGITATPVNRSLQRQQQMTIQQLFHSNAFWAYLDTAITYRERGGEFERPISQVIEQLSRSIEQGELTPFGDVFFIDPDRVVGRSQDLLYIPFQDSAEGTSAHHFVINPIYYGKLVDALKPMFLDHEKGFIAANSIQEAQALTDILNQNVRRRRFAAFYSEMPVREEQETLSEFRAGRINYLVTIRRLDEGLNFPDLSLYVDLNRMIGPRQFLQRAGRILRLYPGQESASIVTVMGISENYVHDLLAILESLGASGRLRASTGPREQQRPHRPASDTLEIPEDFEVRVRSHPFWTHGQRSPAQRTADDLNEFVDQTSRLPLVRGKTQALYARVFRHRHDSQFLEQLSPRARQLLENRPDPARRAGEELNVFVSQNHRMPYRLGEEGSLYRRVREYRYNPNLLEILTPEAKEIFENLPPRSFVDSAEHGRIKSAQRAADELNAFVSHWGRLPSSKPEEKPLQIKVRLYRDEPAFLERLTPETKKMFESSSLSPAQITADELNLFIERFGRMPKTLEKEEALYKRVKRYSSDPKFLERLTPSAEGVWERSQLSTARRTADEFNLFVTRLQRMPKSNGKEGSLWLRIRRVRANPEFFERLTPQARQILRSHS